MNAKAQAVVTTIPMQEASIDIWHSKYQLKTKTGEPVDKDINATYERVAKALAEVENKSVRTQHMKNFIWALQNGAIPAVGLPPMRVPKHTSRQPPPLTAPFPAPFRTP